MATRAIGSGSLSTFGGYTSTRLDLWNKVTPNSSIGPAEEPADSRASPGQQRSDVDHLAGMSSPTRSPRDRSAVHSPLRISMARARALPPDRTNVPFRIPVSVLVIEPIIMSPFMLAMLFVLTVLRRPGKHPTRLRAQVIRCQAKQTSLANIPSHDANAFEQPPYSSRPNHLVKLIVAKHFVSPKPSTATDTPLADVVLHTDKPVEVADERVVDLLPVHVREEFGHADQVVASVGDKVAAPA